MAKSGITNYQQQRILERAFGGVAFSEPLTLYVAVSTTQVLEDGTGVTEPTDISYSRVAVDNNISNWGDVPSGVGRTNLVPIEWNPATADWGTIIYVAIFDQPTGGNVLYFSELVSPKIVGSDDVLRAGVENVQIRIQPTV